MDWWAVAKTVVPEILRIVLPELVPQKAVEEVKQGRRLLFLGSAANVAYFRIEWEKKQLSPPAGWTDGDLKISQNARLRAQMLIGKMCGESGQPAPDLEETRYLDKFFAGLAKANKYSGGILK